MIYRHEGLTLLYDSPDTPAPQGDVAPDKDRYFTAIVKPPNPSNTVNVRYRVDGGRLQQLRAVAGLSDYRQNAQYFKITFPNLALGQRVEYCVSASCAGRQVPAPAAEPDFPHYFRIIGRNNSDSPLAESTLNTAVPERARYELKGEFLARATIRIQAPRIIGPTPDGIRVIWNAVSGKVEGPRLSAKVLQGADWMQIRPDGVANIDVQALLETTGGARIMSIYTGVMEMGEAGYENFLAHNLPSTFSTWTSQRFLTSDAKYKWLTRLQCVGIGRVFIKELKYVYDVHVLR